MIPSLHLCVSVSLCTKSETRGISWYTETQRHGDLSFFCEACINYSASLCLCVLNLKLGRNFLGKP